MTRQRERLIDLAAMAMLLVFTYLIRAEQPALAGMVIGAAIQFWMQKNASAPHSPDEIERVAMAAAAVLRTAEEASNRRRDGDP